MIRSAPGPRAASLPAKDGSASPEGARHEPAGTDSERLARQDRLRSRRDYRQCYELGQRVHGRWATLFVCRNDQPRARLGVTASRRVGKSVVRHRLRRWVKEIFRRSRYRRHLPAVDVVVHLKAIATEATFDELQRALDRQLRRVARQASAKCQTSAQ